MARKLAAIAAAGGGCVKCGYKKNMAALAFHHRDPREKSFLVNTGTMANMSERKILLELAKCDLLCQNCHHELHHPDLAL